MLRSASCTAPPATTAFRDAHSDDGTRLRARTDDPEGRIDGPPVVLGNGLGTVPFAWPALLDPGCGVRGHALLELLARVAPGRVA